MAKKEREHITAMYHRLAELGFTFRDAESLRRISMTLSRWGERECNGEIERDEKTGKPFHYRYGHTGYPVPDRESGALRRLQAILKDHPYSYYYQTDPRGAALYLIPLDDEVLNGKEWVSSNYSSIGIAVY